MQFNANETKLIKNFYENEIRKELTTTLNIDEKCIMVNWNFDETTIHVDLSNEELINIYTFTVTNNNMYFTIESYVLALGTVNGQKYINGVQAKNAGMDLASLNMIKNIVDVQLSKNYNPDSDTKASAEEQNINETHSNEQ